MLCLIACFGCVDGCLCLWMVWVWGETTWVEGRRGRVRVAVVVVRTALHCCMACLPMCNAMQCTHDFGFWRARGRGEEEDGHGACPLDHSQEAPTQPLSSGRPCALALWWTGLGGGVGVGCVGLLTFVQGRQI